MNSDLLDAALKKNQEKRTAMNLPFVVQIITKLKDYSHFGSGCLLSIVDEIVILTCAHNFCSVDKGVNAKPTFMVEKDTHFYLGNGENRRFFNIKKFEIYPKYLNQPEIYDGCVGCGACEELCPAFEAAIVIKPRLTYEDYYIKGIRS